MRSPRLTELAPTDYRRTPWKNGGGVTVDIAAAWTAGAVAGGWDGMRWRLGRTRIERPGPFSELAGYDRVLAVVEGRGLVLHPAGRPPLDVREPFRAVRFPGEWRIESRLEAGPVGVLNLMADRRRHDIDLRFLVEPGTLTPEARIVLLYAVLPSRFQLPGERRELPADHALRLEDGGPIVVTHTDGVLALAFIRDR